MNLLTKIFLVVLRIAIGWHLLYEGITKLQTYQSETTANWSAEGYLRNSSGPFKEHFRNLIPDVFGFERLSVDGAKTEWEVMLSHVAEDYEFTPQQRQNGQELVSQAVTQWKDRLAEPENKKKLDEYLEGMNEWLEREKKPMAPTFKTELREDRGDLVAERREMLGWYDSQTGDLEEQILALRSEAQAAIEPTFRFDRLDSLQQANLGTAWGLTICGGLLLVGLFSRLAALGGACLLALFYFSLPPWPGLPVPPKVEGTYMIVNKNLIEMIALLMLATTSSGVWGGLDALIRGFITGPLFGIGRPKVEKAKASSPDADDQTKK